MIKKNTAILFDFDGVIVNTEPLYDIYMNELGERYNLGIDNLADKVKGMTTPEVIKKYFGHLNDDELEKFKKEMLDFETSMDFPLIEGVLDFIKYLKENDYKVALVTSSQRIKMERALKILHLDSTFDSMVTADRITQGKPHPMCFLLAAKDLNVEPENCIVFEDSINGINAGLASKMKVIGLTTSFSDSEIGDKVYATIPDFSDLNHVITLLA